jgi:hemoglobin
VTDETGKPNLTPSASPYDLFGGAEFFTALVADFYAGVAGDEVLRPMYPEEDLGPAEERLRMFLEQYWGGPSTYQDQRGHPRLRMRHAPYQVDEAARDHWLAHMRTALDARNLPPEADDAMWRYLLSAAQAMVNTSLVTGPESR